MDPNLTAPEVARHAAEAALKRAATARDASEQEMVAAITMARQLGMSWRAIAQTVGRSYATIRQQYGKRID
jgi:hypothetical protein